jgi:hypothetical protein
MNNLPQLVVATIDPQTIANSAKASDVIDLSLFHDVTFYLSLGDIANEDITITLQHDADVNFGSPTTLGSANVVAGSATANDLKQRVYHVEARSVPERYLRMTLVTSDAVGGPMSMIAIATPRYSNSGDLDSVARV